MKKEHVIKLVIIGILAILVLKFGIMAFFSNDPKNTNWASKKLTHEDNAYDVIVVGEEPEGIAAAVSAARMGAKTLLVSQGEDLGGVVSRSMLGYMEINLGDKGQLLNKGIFSELYNKMGSRFTVEKYKSIVTSLVKEESRHLDVLYGAKFESPKLENNTIIGVDLAIKGEKKVYLGKRIIDATRDGDILRACGVPYFTGSEDLNMKDKFLPVSFNFLIKAPNREELKSAVNSFNNKESLIEKYEPSSLMIRVENVELIDQGDNTAIVQGIQVVQLNVADEKKVKKAYEDSALEAKDLVAYLKSSTLTLKNIEFVKAPESFYIREKYHFVGNHTLTVNEILENTNFNDKIAMGSYPIDASKFVLDSTNIVGKPVQYSIPLGCILPIKIENLLMVGSKVSYSSLAATSAGIMSVNVTIGEVAGAEAVFTIVKDMTASELLSKKGMTEMTDFTELLRKQGVYIPEFKVENASTPNFSYPAIKQLRNLGLIAAGMDNNYSFGTDATEEDLALLLINGIYRISPEQYTLALDNRIRKYFTKTKLTKNTASEIVAAVYGVALDAEKAYRKACERGYIIDTLQNQLNDVTILKMEHIYELSAYTIKMFTGKEVSE